MRGLRATLLTGSALLALSFFLPTFGGCWKFTPAGVVAEIKDDDLKGEDRTSDAEERQRLRVESIRFAFICPYLHALLITGLALGAWRRETSGAGRAGLIAAGLAAAGAVVSTATVYLSVDPGKGEEGEVFREGLIPLLLIGWLVTGLCLLGARNARDGRFAVLWTTAAGALPSAVWFGVLFFHADVDLSQNYGWEVGAAGALLMLLAWLLGLRALRRINVNPSPRPADSG